MNNLDKQNLKQRTMRKYFLKRVIAGLTSFYNNPIKIAALIAYIICALLVSQYRQMIFHYPNNDLLFLAIDRFYHILIPVAFLIGLIVLIGPVTVNLAKVPHILLGGSTGSGKSILLKVLLQQCIKKGAKVIIADFKRSVDFPAVWHKKCRFITKESELVEVLNGIVTELNQRNELLALAECANIDEYNKTTCDPLPRLVFACDEVGELLDRTGVSKDEKEIISNITANLATLARLGRAAGIHIILASQRTDVGTVPGNIRNNIGYRVCGRADERMLSQLILENSDAAEQIPKGAQGRFIMNDGTMFQGYLIDEETIFPTEVNQS